MQLATNDPHTAVVCRTCQPKPPTANGLETMVHGEMTADCERPLEQRDAMADITDLAYRKY